MNDGLEGERFYILDDAHGVLITEDLRRWVEFCADPDKWQVANDLISEQGTGDVYQLSTVFLHGTVGLPALGLFKPPDIGCMFETALFKLGVEPGDPDYCVVVDRYYTWSDAEASHRKLVTTVLDRRREQ